MIRLLFCLNRLPALSRAEFQAYWRDVHGPLVVSLAPPLKLRRYVQHHALDDPRLLGVAAVRQAPEPFDGIAELGWDSIDDLLAGDSAARHAGRTLLEDERRFIDLSRSPIFFAEAHSFL